jgi:hypothetical protein
MKAAEGFLKHSLLLGQRASSQTVTTPLLRINVLVLLVSESPSLGLIQGGNLSGIWIFLWIIFFFRQGLFF